MWKVQILQDNASGRGTQHVDEKNRLLFRKIKIKEWRRGRT